MSGFGANIPGGASALADATASAGPVIRVFEPALCCNTGVCGPELDEDLVAFTADLEHLRGRGVDIARHNLANDPGAFAAEASVAAFLKVVGSTGLPLVLVDGVTVATGRYPSRAEFLRFAGRDATDTIGTTDVTGTTGTTDVTGAIDVTESGRRDLGLSAAAAGGGCCGTDAASSGGGSGCCSGEGASGSAGSGCC